MNIIIIAFIILYILYYKISHAFGILPSRACNIYIYIYSPINKITAEYNNACNNNKYRRRRTFDRSFLFIYS
jgi:hypothetical protein